jgi:hypothetical protein
VARIAPAANDDKKASKYTEWLSRRDTNCKQPD